MELLIAILSSSAVSSLATWLLTRKEKQTAGTLSNLDVGQKLDLLIQQKAEADATVTAQGSKIEILNGRIKANQELMLDVVREQGRAEEREKQCRSEVATLKDQIEALTGLSQLTGVPDAAAISDC